ncbi:MAG: hypothetical protein JSU01_15565 [Bacteroidetes bacterium]|nr:hypothetical protein [Bacteroidota bacterium]
MLISSKGNFTAYYDVFNYLIDIIMLYVGIRRNRFRLSDFRLLAWTGVIYMAYMIFRWIFIVDLPIRYFLSDCNFFVERIVMSFLLCAVLRENTAYFIVKITIHLAAFGLIMYALQLISGPFVGYIGRIINLPPRIGNPGYTNIIFFTYDDMNHRIRNSGFSWEPGAYGCYLDIGILMHFLINGFKFDKGAWILTASIVTTLSTTTYACFAFIILLYLRVNGLKLSTMLLFAVPLMCVVATQVPFLADKIGKTWQEDQYNLAEMYRLAGWYQKHGGQLHLNRFGSFIYLYDYFGPYGFFWGVSNAYQSITPIADVLNISNGDADFLCKFGVVGMVFFLHRYILFLKKFLYRNEYIIYCVIIYLVLGFGEPMPIFSSTLCFLFMYHYTNPKAFFTKREEEELTGHELEPEVASV